MKSKILALGAFLLALSGQPAIAGAFGVSPMKVDLSGQVRTSSVTVTNTAKAPLKATVRVVAWATAEDGAESYTDTNDIAFFPKTVMIAPGENQLIRAGIKTTNVSSEKTYRLFIEEQAPEAPSTGVNLAVRLSFGVPVFVHGASAAPSLTAKATLNSETVTLTLTNDGTAHARLSAITPSEMPALKLKSNYVLANSRRVVQFPLTKELCGQSSPKVLIQSTVPDIELNLDAAAACAK